MECVHDHRTPFLSPPPDGHQSAQRCRSPQRSRPARRAAGERPKAQRRQLRADAVDAATLHSRIGWRKVSGRTRWRRSGSTGPAGRPPTREMLVCRERTQHRHHPGELRRAGRADGRLGAPQRDDCAGSDGRGDGGRSGVDCRRTSHRRGQQRNSVPDRGAARARRGSRRRGDHVAFHVRGHGRRDPRRSAAHDHGTPTSTRPRSRCARPVSKSA